jgi:hypothetical protein
MLSTPDNRRRSLLTSIVFGVGSPQSVRDLVREMSTVHGIAVSADLVRGDLTWLAEQGLVRKVEDAALHTERGRDVALGNAPWPGA